MKDSPMKDRLVNTWPLNMKRNVCWRFPRPFLVSMICWKESGYNLLQQKDREQNFLRERHMGQSKEKTGHDVP